MVKKNTDSPVIGVDLGGTKILAGVVDATRRPAGPIQAPDQTLGRR